LNNLCSQYSQVIAAAALARHDKRMRGLVVRDDSSPTYTLSRSEQ
jgi:hypothetical protein